MIEIDTFDIEIYRYLALQTSRCCQMYMYSIICCLMSSIMLSDVFYYMLFLQTVVNFGGLLLQALLEHWPRTHSLEPEETSGHGKTGLFLISGSGFFLQMSLCLKCFLKEEK